MRLPLVALGKLIKQRRRAISNPRLVGVKILIGALSGQKGFAGRAPNAYTLYQRPLRSDWRTTRDRWQRL